MVAPGSQDRAVLALNAAAGEAERSLGEATGLRSFLAGTALDTAPSFQRAR